MKILNLTVGPIVGETTDSRVRIWGRGRADIIDDMPRRCFGAIRYKAVRANGWKPMRYFKRRFTMRKVAYVCALMLTLVASISEAGDRDFAGLSFGVGLSLTHDVGSNDRVKSVSVVNNIVRVDDEENDVARIMLETHYFFTPSWNILGVKNTNNKDGSANIRGFGIGPFVAVQPGTDEIIEAIGLGIMIGFKRNDNKEDLSSWNIGFGAVIDPNVTVLGSGIKKNKALPVGETEARTREKSQLGFLIITSFGF